MVFRHLVAFSIKIDRIKYKGRKMKMRIMHDSSIHEETKECCLLQFGHLCSFLHAKTNCSLGRRKKIHIINGIKFIKRDRIIKRCLLDLTCNKRLEQLPLLLEFSGSSSR